MTSITQRAAAKVDARPTILLWSLVLLGLAARLYLALATPIFYAPDEVAHFLYIQQIALHGRLPIQPLDYASTYLRGQYEFYQPPGFYLLAAPFARIFGPGVGAVYAVRIVNVLLGTLLVRIVWAIALVTMPGRIDVAATATSFAAFLPGLVINSAAVNNDVLESVLASAMMLMLVRTVNEGRLSFSRAGTIGVVGGAAILTKGSGILLLLVIGFCGIVLAVSGRRQWWQVGMACVTALTITAPWWLLRNLSAYHDLLALGLNNLTPDGPMWVRLSTALLRQSAGFWLYGGRIAEIVPPGSILNVPAIAVIAAVVLLTSAVIRNSGFDTANRRGALILLVELLVVGIAALQYGVAHGQGQGRFLYPAVAPVAFAVAVAVANVTDRRDLRPAAWLGSIMVVYFVLVYALVLGPTYARVRPVTRTHDLTETWYTAPDYDTWIGHS